MPHLKKGTERLLSSEWDHIKMIDVNDPIPNGLLRYNIADLLQTEDRNIDHPSLIKNEVSRICMQRSYDCQGREWDHFKNARWHQIEMSRNYFNPVEATVELSLSKANFKFQGGIGRDVEVPSLLHKLGMKNTKLSEDFILWSNKLKKPVYIQCKSSGGGRDQHGKNIQNRTKEQITRSILYSCDFISGKIVLASKMFHWISILDGNWGVTVEQPAKYIHMLQWAGYDKLIGSEELITSKYVVKDTDNPLINHLISLDCERVK